MRSVAHEDWLNAWADLYSSGLTYFDFLTAVDRVDTIDIVAHTVNAATVEHALLLTSVPASAARVDSLGSLYRGAGWHERETAEMFGVVFVGLLDARPLLLRTALGRPPLLKSAVLAARVALEWPGAAEPVSADGGTGRNASRRRQRPPGAPDGWLEVEA